MSALPSSPKSQELLLYGLMYAGMQFAPSQLPTSSAWVSQYTDITGDHNPLYFDPAAAAAAGHAGPILPPGLAGVWARHAYAGNVRMPSGGVIASMDVQIPTPALVGEMLDLTATVAELDRSDPRRRVVIHARAEVDRSGLRMTVGQVVVDARWSAQDSDDDG